MSLPDICTDEHLDYLDAFHATAAGRDDCRAVGDILHEKFPALTKDEAFEIARHWLDAQEEEEYDEDAD